MLKELVKARGIKQKWLAQRLGVSEVTVSNWIKGKAVPKKEHLDKLSLVLGVKLSELR